MSHAHAQHAQHAHAHAHVPPQETDKLLAASPPMPPPPSAGDPEMAAWLSAPASEARGLSARPRLTAR